MPFKAQPGIGIRHTRSIVNNLNQCSPRIFDNYLDPVGPGVHSIFHQLFHSRCRALYYFTCRNLVRNRIGQYLDQFRHSEYQIFTQMDKNTKMIFHPTGFSASILL
jgi:hypothetical protein